MHQLSKKDRVNYIRSPHHCPYCKSNDIEGQHMHFDDPLTQDVECLNCTAKWKDVHGIVGILEDTDGR